MIRTNQHLLFIRFNLRKFADIHILTSVKQFVRLERFVVSVSFGPSIDPWGTPQFTKELGGTWSPIETKELRLTTSESFQIYQPSACSLFISILWSTVSKAALKSRSTRMEHSSSSAVQ